LKADRTGASALIDQMFSEGLTASSVISDILDPSLLRLGQHWEQKQVSLAQAYVGGKIAEDILLRCIPDESAQSMMKCKGVVVVGNIEDDFHSLGRRIVVSFLRASGWFVHDLGNDVPAEQFVETALQQHASVIGVSAMMQTTALNIRKVRDAIDSRKLSDCLKLAVGGAVFNWRPELVAEVGGDATARNAATADTVFQRLQAEAGKERPI
jgi:methanogenic corrinoid protein MtbC1